MARWSALALGLAGPLLALAAITGYTLLVFTGDMPRALWVVPWPMLAAIAVGLALAIVHGRRRRRWSSLWVTAVLALGFAIGLPLATRLPAAPGAPTAPGETPPDFTLPSSAGGQVTLSELRGHRVVLVFHRGHW